jgi:ADP-dependent NAD(P)H-hydrate dehydratase / NAD(P)H-hydrate epimerase
VLAIGPGLGRRGDVAKFTAGLLGATKIPAVVDADALNILAAKPVLLIKKSAKGRTLVLTPHPGEMARLAGVTVAEVQANRLETARALPAHGRYAGAQGRADAHRASRWPRGREHQGNPGMAKGGSGDLLTGLIAGLLAQYP